jgi:hypothetical protein
LGDALSSVAEWARAEAVLEEAIEGAQAVGDPRLEWNARIGRSHVRRLTDPRAWAGQRRHEVEQAIEACEVLGYEQGLVRAWLLLAFIEHDLGHNRAAEKALDRALGYARRSQDRRAESAILGMLAHVAVFGPMPVADAIPLLEGHLQLAKAGGARRWEAQCDGLLAVLWAMRGQFVKALGVSKCRFGAPRQRLRW